MKNKTLIIACKVFKDQIEQIGNVPHDVLYLEQGLHRTPQNLTEELQELIGSSKQYTTIILGYGLCSRAVIGLHGAPHQTIVIPRIDDCIGICMGSRSLYLEEFMAHPGTYYFTRGWHEAAEDPLRRYHETVEKYGEEIAEWTVRDNLKHYERTVFIRNDEDGDKEAKDHAQEFARFFNLNYEEVNGSLEYLRQLIYGPWDDNFVVVQDGQDFIDEMFQDFYKS